MATKTLNIAFKANGALADLDQVPLFTDATGTYGVRKASDGTVIVPAETVGSTLWTRLSLGTYQAVITGLTDGVEYDYSIRTVYNGATKHSPGDFIAGGGHYSTVALIRLKLGQTNADAYAAGSAQDIESTGTQAVIDAQEEYALTESDARVNLKLITAGVTLPFVAPSSYVGTLVEKAATAYAAGFVLKFRWDQRPGTSTANEKGPGDILIAEGDEIMDALVEAGALTETTEDDTTTAAGTWTQVPIAYGVESLGDEFSSLLN